MLGAGACIVLHRRISWASLFLRLSVRIDNQEVAKLRIGKKATIDVSPGPHVVRVMYGNREVKYRNRTGSLPVPVGPDETVRVRFWTTAHPFQVMLTADESQ